MRQFGFGLGNMAASCRSKRRHNYQRCGFRFLSATRKIGPQVVLIKFGNTRKQVLLSRFAAALPAIIAALESGEHLIEVR
jgi:hypothetical protein